MRAITIRRGVLLGLCLAVTLSIAACTSGQPNSVGQMSPSTASHTDASPAAAAPGATPGTVPSVTAWLAAAEIPFNSSYTWSLFSGRNGETPIGQPEGNGVYFIAPDSVFQAITACGQPSLMLTNTLGARQRLFEPTTGVMTDQAGQWISSYPDATTAQAAWHGLQATYAACRAQEGTEHITLTENAESPNSMAWFLSTDGARVGDLSTYTHEYFVLDQNEIAYVFARGEGSALAAQAQDAQVLAIIAQHLSA